MKPVTIKMDIPEKVSTNKATAGWKHWSVRKKLNDLYHKAMIPYKRQLRGKEPKWPVKITYTFYWRVWALDTTNQTIMMKMIEDGLRHIGFLPDDTPEYVRSSESISIKDSTLEKDYVTIKISPVEESYKG